MQVMSLRADILHSVLVVTVLSRPFLWKSMSGRVA